MPPPAKSLGTAWTVSSALPSDLAARRAGVPAVGANDNGEALLGRVVAADSKSSLEREAPGDSIALAVIKSSAVTRNGILFNAARTNAPSRIGCVADDEHTGVLVAVS